MFKLTLIAGVLLVTTAINFAAFYISWQRRQARGGLSFAAGMLALTVWTLAAGFDYAAVPISLKVFFAKLEYTGSSIALVCFAAFVLTYAGYERRLNTRVGKALAIFIPLSNIGLAWTNDLHGWLWTGFRYSEIGDNTAIFEHGPAFAWVVITGYLMITIIIVTLWQASRRGSGLARRQASLLFWTSLIPVVGNLFYLLQEPELQGIDWTSVTFSITGLLFLAALYGARLLDLAPIARDKLVSSLSDGMIVIDSQNRIIDINDPATRMIGLRDTSLIGKDLIEVAPITRPFLAESPTQEIKTQIEFGTQSKRYFDVLISPLYEGNQLVIGRLIIFRDITEHRKNELRLLQLTQAVEQSPASVVVTDLKGNIEYVNPQFTILTGYTQAEAIGKNPNILQSGQTPIEVYRDLWQTIQAGQTWQGEFLNKKKNGELYWEQAVIAPVLGRDGQILNYIAVKENITKRKQAEEALQAANRQLGIQLEEIKSLQASLREQAIRDPLTELYNRRFLNDAVEHEFHRAQRLAQPVSIILLDIDHFKSINDRHGHTAGDAYLVMLANLARQHTRKSDIVCRYGGEEFLLVLPDTTLEAATHQAEKLRRLCAEAIQLFDGQELKATISLGVASFPTHGAHHGEIIYKADQALYLSKTSGRNRVTAWADGQSED